MLRSCWRAVLVIAVLLSGPAAAEPNLDLGQAYPGRYATLSGELWVWLSEPGAIHWSIDDPWSVAALEGRAGLVSTQELPGLQWVQVPLALFVPWLAPGTYVPALRWQAESPGVMVLYGPGSTVDVFAWDSNALSLGVMDEPLSPGHWHSILPDTQLF